MDYKKEKVFLVYFGKQDSKLQFDPPNFVIPKNGDSSIVVTYIPNDNLYKKFKNIGYPNVYFVFEKNILTSYSLISNDDLIKRLEIIKFENEGELKLSL